MLVGHRFQEAENARCSATRGIVADLLGNGVGSAQRPVGGSGGGGGVGESVRDPSEVRDGEARLIFREWVDSDVAWSSQMEIARAEAATERRGMWRTKSERPSPSEIDCAHQSGPPQAG